MADMLWNTKKRKSALKMAIWAAKTAFVVIGFGFTVAFTSLIVIRFLNLLRSSQSSIWFTIQLIVVAIWKLSNSKRHGNRPHNHDNPATPPPDAPETWYDVPSSTATSTIIAPPEGVISPETVAEAASSSSSDGNDSMDATWKKIMEGRRSHAGPVLKKYPTWEMVQDVEVVAEQAAAGRERRKSRKAKAAMVEEGWTRRDVLVVSQDELLRRVETFMKRQESEQRRFLRRLRRHSY